MTPNPETGHAWSEVRTEADRNPAPLVDTTGGITYTGDAPLGTPEDAPLWRIRRTRVVGTVTRTEYAGGNMRFENAWSSRATLTYSR